MADLDRIIRYLTGFVAARERVTGATIGEELTSRFPEFDYREEGYRSLTDLLDRAAPELSIVGRSGLDYLWSSGPLDLDTPVADPLDDEDSDPDTNDAFDGVEPEHIHFNRVVFQNFKTLVNQVIPLDPFTVFVGANGTGKSSVLEGIFLLGQLRNKKPRTVFTGPRSPLRLRSAGSSGAMKIAVEDTTTACSASLEVTWPRGAHGPRDLGERHVVQVAVGAKDLSYDFASKLPAGQPAPRRTPVFQAFGGTVLLRLQAHKIARPSYSEQETPFVRHDGYGVVSVLAHLATTDRPRLDRIIAAIREVVPGFEDIKMPRAEVRRTEQQVVVIDGEEFRRRVESKRWGNRLEAKINGHWHEADLLSEGTLLTIGLMTIVCASMPSPRILLMDDVDRALHPNAQRRLIKQLQGIQKSAHNLQILCTTHSPYILDDIDAESVRVMRTVASGEARCRRLTDHAKWQEWRESMSAGEFWTFVGEQWLEEEA